MKSKSTHLLSKLLFIGILLLSHSILAQTLFIEENFEFAAESNVIGQNDWSLGTTGDNSVLVTSASLDYPEYPNTDLGKSAYFEPLTDRIQKSFDGPLVGKYYYSFLINVSEAGTGDFFIGLFSNNAFRGRAYIKADEAGFQFGLTKTSTGAPGGVPQYTEGTPYEFNTTYLVVVEYDFQTGSGKDDIVSLFVNPNLSAEELPTVPTLGPLTDGGNDVAHNTLAIQGRTNSGKFIIDGIRVAPNWASIKGEDVANHFLELPNQTSSHMVLQRDTPLKFNGWGLAGDKVKVTFENGSETFTETVTIDSEGRWKAELASQPITITGCDLSFELVGHPESKQSFNDILIGDVWFAGGQSNMEKKVNHLLEASDYIAEADNYPMIRTFRASYYPNNTPQEKVNGASNPWTVCNSAEVADVISAVAYVYARELNDELGIPIGIVQAYRGGTEIETWMSNEKITTDPELCTVAGRIPSMNPSNNANYPSIHFNGQVNPLINIPLKGFIFYQGESNTKRAPEYRLMMKKLIEDWRSLWDMGDLPFYYVQMFNMGPTHNQVYEEGNWQDIREQQLLLLTADNVPNIGMAVTIDTNDDPNNSDDNIRIHPKNKKPVGERLAMIALKNTYGKEIIGESPVVNNYHFSNDSAIIVFKNEGTGLKVKTGDTELVGFVIAGSDKVFKPATATIKDKNTVIVKSNEVAAPMYVRYAWAKNPVCNLYNSADLPASPFRSDILPSGFSYGNFLSTCISSDADLLTIQLNGETIDGFEAAKTIYSSDLVVIPSIAAITNSPFASIEISQPSSSNGMRATITVTSEDNTEKIYEIGFSQATGVINTSSNNMRCFQEGKKLVVENKSNSKGQIQIYNTSGQTILNKLLENGKNEFQLSHPGVYILIVSTLNESNKYKFILK